MFILVSFGGVRPWIGNERVINSFGGIGYPSDAWIEGSGAIAPRHLCQRNDLDLRGVAGSPELLEALPAEIAQTVHCRFQEFARIEFTPRLCRDLAECSSHRQPAVGVDIDLADAVLDAADDF